MTTNNLLKAYRESTMPSIMLMGTFIFGGVFFLINEPFIHTGRLGEILIYLTPIPYVVYWMVKEDKTVDKDAQRSRS